MSEYRKRAEECVRLAQSAKPHQRLILLDIATKWLELADQDAQTQTVRDGIVRAEIAAKKKVDGHGTEAE